MCHRTGAMPVHRCTSFAPLLSLPARPQRSRGRPLRPVDRVVEWVHRARCPLHGSWRSSPLHRAYRVNSPANATRQKQPGQESHPLALPTNRRRAPQRPVAQTPQSASRLTRPTRSGSQSQPYAHRRWLVESRAWPRRSFRYAPAAGGGGGVRVDRPSPDRAGHWRGWRAGRAACRPARRPPPAGLPDRAAPPGPAGRLGPSRRARG
jgi:hypothetical protein